MVHQESTDLERQSTDGVAGEGRVVQNASSTSSKRLAADWCEMFVACAAQATVYLTIMPPPSQWPGTWHAKK